MEADDLKELALRRAHDVLKEDCGDANCHHDACEAWRLVEAALAPAPRRLRVMDAYRGIPTTVQEAIREPWYVPPFGSEVYRPVFVLADDGTVGVVDRLGFVRWAPAGRYRVEVSEA